MQLLGRSIGLSFRSLRIAPRSLRLTPRTFLLSFVLASVLVWIILFFTPSRPWQRRPGPEWRPAVYNHPNKNRPPHFPFRNADKDNKAPASATADADRPPCANLPGADNILVVMKTGASESRRKLPPHFDTTFRCVPHYTIFSDLEEQVGGYPVHDSLDDVTPARRYTHPDFELYRQMLDASTQGRKDFSDFVMVEKAGDPNEHAGETEKEETRAWQLDKWKFLPLLDKALARRPTAKWFVFIEADTALIWSTLVQYLNMLDAEKPFYIGGQAYSFDDEIEFAHGGAGYILSNSAMRKANDAYKKEPTRFDDMVDEECCGDVIVGKVLAEVGVELLRAWPNIQGETPSTLDYTEYHWCHAVMSYHHMGPDELTTMWNFEQEWLHANYPHKPITHAAIFDAFVAPHITRPRSAWDNLSNDRVLTPSTPSMAPDETHATTSLDACRAHCETRTECMQWAYATDSCRIGYVLRLGVAQEKAAARDRNTVVTSGWIRERVDDFRERLGVCEPRWITSNDLAAQ